MDLTNNAFQYQSTNPVTQEEEEEEVEQALEAGKEDVPNLLSLEAEQQDALLLGQVLLERGKHDLHYQIQDEDSHRQLLGGLEDLEELSLEGPTTSIGGQTNSAEGPSHSVEANLVDF